MSDYYRLDFSITPYTTDAADLLAAFLADIGFDSFEASPEGLAAYIPSGMFDEDEVKNELTYFPIKAEIKWEKEFIKHRDWNEEWEKKYFKPLVLGGGRCVVHSTFHVDYPDSEYEIIIDPKMAFGTGHHATTTMMVNHLFELDLKGKKVVDMGAGTGILSILAKKLGAKEVIGIEIDPAACDNADENKELNHAEVSFICGDASKLENIREVDIFLANINRNIILADLEPYAATLKKGGVIVLSGFYKNDIPLLEAALNENGMKIADTCQEGMDEWSSIRAYKA